MTANSIVPRYTLEEVYGTDTCFNCRPSFGPEGWQPEKQFIRDCMAQIAQIDTGTTPYACARALCCPQTIALLERAGHTVSPHAELYSTEEEFLTVLRNWAAAGRTVAFQYLLPEETVSRDCYWISPQLLSDLNNKGFLEQVVPAEHVPKRYVVSPAEVPSLKLGSVPMVLKAASIWGGGAGCDVVMARTQEDLEHAAKLFAADQVVVEEYLDIVSNVCVNMATVDGRAVHLGTARQLVDDAGVFYGNWIVPDTVGGESAQLGVEILQRAMQLGFRGFAGVDMAITRDGRVLAYDLNFRMNASTRPLLIYESVRQKFGPNTICHLTGMIYPGPYAEFCQAVRTVIDACVVLPMCLHNPELSPHSEAASRMTALILGEDADEIFKAHRWLAELGFEVKFPIAAKRAAA